MEHGVFLALKLQRDPLKPHLIVPREFNLLVRGKTDEYYIDAFYFAWQLIRVSLQSHHGLIRVVLIVFWEWLPAWFKRLTEPR